MWLFGQIKFRQIVSSQKMGRKASIDVYVISTYALNTMEKVELEKVRKKLKKIPSYIVLKLLSWAKDVEVLGLSSVRKSAGLHDEPLKGKWAGYRSIRLSRGYRAIYILEPKTKELTIVDVVDVSNHEY